MDEQVTDKIAIAEEEMCEENDRPTSDPENEEYINLFNVGQSLCRIGKYDEAIAKLQPLAVDDYGAAQYYMGVCYYKGKQDLTKALEWFEKAYQKEKKYIYEPDCPLSIAQLFFEGNGVSRDLTKAVVWYERVPWVVNSIYAKAQLALGDCYRLGQGVEKDISKAMKCYSSAYACCKSREGLKMLKQLAKEGVEGAKEAVEKAKDFYKQMRKAEREGARRARAELRKHSIYE